MRLHQKSYAHSQLFIRIHPVGNTSNSGTEIPHNIPRKRSGKGRTADRIGWDEAHILPRKRIGKRKKSRRNRLGRSAHPPPKAQRKEEEQPTE